MPSAGLGGSLEAGCVWTSGGGRASRLYRVALHNSFPNFLILFLLVLGQEEVQEEGHDEADGVLEGTSGEKNSLGPVCPVPATVRSILVTIPADRKRGLKI